MQLPDPQICCALARAVVDAKKWTWLAGMQGSVPESWGSFRVLKVQDGEVVAWLFTGTEGAYMLTDHDDGPFASWTPTLPDLTDPLTAAGAQIVAETVLNEPTLHLVPVSIDRYYDAEPITHWRVERMVDGESEWLRESGTWGEWEAEAHKDPPICCKTKLEALIAAILAAPETK